MKSIFLFFLTCCTSLFLVAQETFPVNGTRDKDVTYQVFKNATIITQPGVVMENATLIVYQGKILNLGVDIETPEGAVVYDVEGQFIYPSFVDLYADYGMPKIDRPMWKPSPQYDSKTKGAFAWVESIKPETNASQLWSHDAKSSEKLRSFGIGTVLTHQQDGIARGSGCLVQLGESENTDVLISEASAHYSFSKGSSRQKYPSSLMGSIALLRQTFLDAEWYNSSWNESESNLSLEAWNELQGLPQVMQANSKLNILRADKIGDEFDVQFIFKGSGDEYQRIEEIKATEGALIIPINFPKAYDVSEPYNERMVSLEEMKHWEAAPHNLAMLEESNIPFAITAEGIKSSKEFLGHLRKAVSLGLSKEKALEALTIFPASLLGADEMIGSLEIGKKASFLICSKDLFEKDCVLYENWVSGEQFVLNDRTVVDLKGNYELTLNNKTYVLEVKGTPGKQAGSIQYISKKDNKSDTTSINVNLGVLERQVTMKIDHEDLGLWRFSGNVFKDSKIWEGTAKDIDGNWKSWIAVRKEIKEEETPKKKEMPAMDSLTLSYPLMAYGWTNEPEQETLLIKNATLWTCEEEGKIENGQILIHQGKIMAVGKDIDLTLIFPKQKVQLSTVDAKGMHVTPGIIDEHSHIAVSGSVNEGSQASSAEVSIASVVDSDDVNIYRQLAGGVTTAQLLHGSANPIGGQSGIIKMRWGHSPDEMLMEEAVPFIKFALGENVKQSNWGDFERVRFPQSRMGVEQVYYDHFIRAREYDQTWKEYNEGISLMKPRQIRKEGLPDPPRRDLELECLAQILNKERFITCHSYRQDEINMLMHVADSMGFTLNTFTHILEGYKVADKMKEHGAGGSTFSDWWAYKFEVKDAIPYNAAMLYEQGIVTAINSDDAEMARRLNQEAAKAVKYGGVPEEEALKMVTLNPAKLLHLDDHIGSLKVGKDADFVIWTDHPLSIYAQVDATYVDGKCYFSQEKDLEKRKEIQKERARLIKMMLDESAGGAPTQQPKMKREKVICCDSMDSGEINITIE